MLKHDKNDVAIHNWLEYDALRGTKHNRIRQWSELIMTTSCYPRPKSEGVKRIFNKYMSKMESGDNKWEKTTHDRWSYTIVETQEEQEKTDIKTMVPIYIPSRLRHIDEINQGTSLQNIFEDYIQYTTEWAEAIQVAPASDPLCCGQWTQVIMEGYITKTRKHGE